MTPSEVQGRRRALKHAVQMLQVGNVGASIREAVEIEPGDLAVQCAAGHWFVALRLRLTVEDLNRMRALGFSGDRSIVIVAKELADPLVALRQAEPLAQGAVDVWHFPDTQWSDPSWWALGPVRNPRIHSKHRRV